MATQPRIVNKQFNSPIKMYSPKNVQEVLEKETQMLANGAVGIDFHQLAKPANLKNSAVLRMLEEEENRKRNGHPGTKQVIWPPPADSDEFNNEIVEEAPVYAQGGPQFQNQQSSPVQNQHQQAPQQQRNKPVSPNFQQPQYQQQQQQQQQQQPLSPQQFSGQQQQNRWAPVPSPAVAHPQSPQLNKPQQQQFQQPAQQQQPVYRPPVAVPEPPPTTIVLRPQQPISQAPAPIYTSQPATASLNGGNNMRGDQKWPPATVKARMDDENEQRIQVAKGPAFRPRKVKKDYSGFFAQHALNSTYPGYKAPPGTQYYEENSGATNF